MLQTILVPKDKFSLSEAYVWLANHHYSHHKIDITEHFYRFRQNDPHGGSYYTVRLPNGIQLVHENRG
jgi:hypothetical protein